MPNRRRFCDVFMKEAGKDTYYLDPKSPHYALRRSVVEHEVYNFP